MEKLHSCNYTRTHTHTLSPPSFILFVRTALLVDQVWSSTSIYHAPCQATYRVEYLKSCANPHPPQHPLSSQFYQSNSGEEWGGCRKWKIYLCWGSLLHFQPVTKRDKPPALVARNISCKVAIQVIAKVQNEECPNHTFLGPESQVESLVLSICRSDTSTMNLKTKKLIITHRKNK